MPIAKVLQLNLVNREFYDKIVPEIMRNRKMYPSIDLKLHLFIRDDKLYGHHLDNNTPTIEIDFEQDEWRHDNQYIFADKSLNGSELILDLKKFWDEDMDPSVRLNKDEEILLQYIIQLHKYKYLIFPLKDALKLTRGILVECRGGVPSYKAMTGLPEDLHRPGIALQKNNGRVVDILFLGGNEQKMCYCYNLEMQSHIPAGSLPTFHLVTEQINVQYEEDQTLTIYAQVNFDSNLFQICSAINNQKVSIQDESNNAAPAEWKWIFREDVDIENFHIKSAFIHMDRLMIFSRGKPRNERE